MFEIFRLKAKDMYVKSFDNEVKEVYKAIKDRTVIGRYGVAFDALSDTVKAMLIADGYRIKNHIDGRRIWVLWGENDKA